MRQFLRILCPIDFSDESRHALEHAAQFARWYDAAITGLFVYSPIFVGPGLQSSPMPPVIERIDKRAYECDVLSFIRHTVSPAIDVAADVQVGLPAQEIVSAATRLPVDLIVIGTHGISGFEHLMLGSIAEKVLRTSRVPVLTVPPRAQATSKLPFQEVLCPVDFSSCSREAVHLAMSVAEEGDANLTILHVLESIGEVPFATRHFNVPEFRREYEQWAKEKLRTLLPDDAADRCRPTTVVADGKPYREILNATAHDGTDLIVMGVHGRNPLDLMLFGSTTNQVVRRATCPVLTVRR
jgi:nucleotide-binding universal stress UspA family protein